jgi:hypothetical protein
LSHFLGALGVLRGGTVYFRSGLGGCEGGELIEPGVGDHDVVVEKKHVFAARQLQPLINGGRKSAIGGIGNHRDRHGRRILHAAQIRARAISRAIIDDDQLPGPACMALERGDAVAGKLELVPAGDDDRCEPTDGIAIHGSDSPQRKTGRFNHGRH